MSNTDFIRKEPIRYLVIFVFVVVVAVATVTGNSKKLGESIIDGCMFVGKPIAHFLMTAFEGTIGRDIESK